ncbi:hypothetical protein [Photobacterium leiognathi]|uniref:hypothetical protein n=1 Tax=Photobacterium leiognathi TaxID=553611 RepID=UPI003AF3B053
MGERSKTIGEIGENIAGNFCDLVGWSNPQLGVSIDCIYKQKHALDSSKKGEKSTHGIDILHSYQSSLEEGTANTLLISVKHIKETKYPESVTVKVKGYFKDLLDTVDCYKKSKLKKSFIAKHIGCKTLNEIPVLFYISSHKDDSEHSNYIEKIKSTSFLSDHDVRELYVIDNNKLTFILNSLDYIKNKKSDYEWFFYSPYTGMNIAESAKKILKSITS